MEKNAVFLLKERKKKIFVSRIVGAIGGLSLFIGIMILFLAPIGSVGALDSYKFSLFDNEMSFLLYGCLCCFISFCFALCGIVTHLSVLSSKKGLNEIFKKYLKFPLLNFKNIKLTYALYAFAIIFLFVALFFFAWFHPEYKIDSFLEEQTYEIQFMSYAYAGFIMCVIGMIMFVMFPLISWSCAYETKPLTKEESQQILDEFMSIKPADYKATNVETEMTAASKIEKLEQLAKLHENNILSDEEYEKLKKELINDK